MAVCKKIWGQRTSCSFGVESAKPTKKMSGCRREKYRQRLFGNATDAVVYVYCPASARIIDFADNSDRQCERRLDTFRERLWSVIEIR